MIIQTWGDPSDLKKQENKQMKTSIPILTLFLFIIFGCNNRKDLVGISFDKRTQFTTFIIKDKDVTRPIVFKTFANSGSIFFETAKGKHWIKSKPEVLDVGENSFISEWEIDQRKITITFLKKDGKYEFSFKAQPNEDIIKWGFNLQAIESECFSGLFERVVDGEQRFSWEKGIDEAMNLRGQSVDMFIKPTLSLYCPYFLSSNGYSVFIEGTWPGHYDFCKTNPEIVQIEFEGPALNGIIYTSSSPAEMVKSHSLHVGPTIIPPKWAFMPYRWRDNNHHFEKYYDGTPVNAPYNSMLVEDILMMEAFDIPCGVYWIDRPWAKTKKEMDFWLQGFADYEWNEEQIPNPQGMIKWLESKNINLLLWISPWITGDWVKEANDKRYAVKQKDFDTTKLVLMDFTNPEGIKWWQENGPAKVIKDGVKGFKLDRGEEIVMDRGDFKYANGKSAREMRNAFPTHYVKATHDVCKKYLGDDFVLFPRAGYSGSSKYSAFWGGDHGSPAEGLRCAIISAQRAAIIGYPIWGSDIGGYWQGELDREVVARWLAFGCFNPIMEFGPTADKAPWSMATEPHYDTTLIATWRLYAKIHTKLVDYSYALAKEANATGMPIIRPLFLEYPDQKKAWQDWQTFTYGSEILVSAIWEKGKTSHKCYLPAGSKWMNAWDKNEVYEGGRIVEISTPLHKIPIFIKEGSLIDLGDLNQLYEESLELARHQPNLKELERQFDRSVDHK